MTPPEAPDQKPGKAPPAVFACVERMKKRADFLACARASKAVTPGFVLQGRDRGDGDGRVRVGFTASKKVGNAVARNRAKRRLRALAAQVLPAHARPGWDYVLIARRDVTATRDFATLTRDLERALDRLHARPRHTR